MLLPLLPYFSVVGVWPRFLPEVSGWDVRDDKKSVLSTSNHDEIMNYVMVLPQKSVYYKPKALASVSMFCWSSCHGYHQKDPVHFFLISTASGLLNYTTSLYPSPDRMHKLKLSDFHSAVTRFALKCCGIVLYLLYWCSDALGACKTFIHKI